MAASLGCATAHGYVDQDTCEVEVHCPFRRCEATCEPGGSIEVTFEGMSQALAGAIGVVAGWVAGAL
jgi:hypothetical protein